MVLPITATKTFREWTEANPNFYDDMLQAGAIDEATIGSIYDWFRFRTICDDERFDVFYGRQLELVLPRYYKLLRLETTDFDALVSVYRERQVSDSRTSSETSETTETHTGTETDAYTSSVIRTPDLTEAASGTLSEESTRTPDITVAESSSTSNETERTPNLTVQDSGSNTSTTETDTSSTSSSESEGESDNVNRSVSKQNPQSISYAAATAGEIPTLDWQYPTTQAQSDAHNTNSSESSGSNTSSSDSETNGTTTNTQTTTGTDTTESTGSASNTQHTTGTEENERESNTQNIVTNTGTETISEASNDTKGKSLSIDGDVDKSNSSEGLRQEIYTGRDGLTPQEALREAMSYVKISSAFEWLKENLEIVFVSVYDI